MKRQIADLDAQFDDLHIETSKCLAPVANITKRFVRDRFDEANCLLAFQLLVAHMSIEQRNAVFIRAYASTSSLDMSIHWMCRNPHVWRFIFEKCGELAMLDTFGFMFFNCVIRAATFAQDAGDDLVQQLAAAYTKLLGAYVHDDDDMTPSMVDACIVHYLCTLNVFALHIDLVDPQTFNCEPADMLAASRKRLVAPQTSSLFYKSMLWPANIETNQLARDLFLSKRSLPDFQFKVHKILLHVSKLFDNNQAVSSTKPRNFFTPFDEINELVAGMLNDCKTSNYTAVLNAAPKNDTPPKHDNTANGVEQVVDEMEKLIADHDKMFEKLNRQIESIHKTETLTAYLRSKNFEHEDSN